MPRRRVLHAACWRGNVELVTVLVDAGAALDHATHEGATALFVAAQKGHPPPPRITRLDARVP